MLNKIKKLSKEEIRELDIIWFGKPELPEPLRKVLDAVDSYEEKSVFEFMAICPVHDDHNPSLSIKWLPGERKILLKCFGCDATFKDLVKAMGLSQSEMFLPMPVSKKIVATYDYRDEQGHLLYQNVRFKPKGFAQRRPEGKGGWIWNLNGVQRVLYRLPELLSADSPEVCIVEGEKDVEKLREFGWIATTSGAAGSWKSDFNEYLRGREVVIIPDRDEAGKNHGEQIAHELFGVASRVKILKLWSGKDVSDYFQVGGSEEELGSWISMTPLIKEPPVYSGGPTVIWLDTVELKEVLWLWPDRIPLGKLTLLAGEAGIGKSLLTLDIAARISTGTAWPDDRETPDIGSVLILTTEDDTDDTVAVRLAAAGANLSKIAHVKNVFDMGEIVDKATKILKTRDDIRLIILDPLTEFLGNADSHKNADVRRALVPLISFASEHNIAILGVTHYAKAEKSSAANKIIGSIAFNATARQVWHVFEDGSQRLFVAGKANLTGKHSGLAYTIVETTIQYKDKQLSTVKIKFSPGEIYETAQDVLQRLHHKPSKLEIAEDFLESLLADGPKDKNEIEKLAGEQYVKLHTLRTARENMRIVIEQTGKGNKGSKKRKSTWRLP